MPSCPPPDRPDPADPRQLPPCRPVHRRDDRDHRAVSGPGAQQNDGSFGSDIHQTIALLNLLIRVAPVLNASTAGEAIRNKDFLRVAPILDYIRDNLAGAPDPGSDCRQVLHQQALSVPHLQVGHRLFRHGVYHLQPHPPGPAAAPGGGQRPAGGELSGFSDNSHFIRTFGHLTGTSPAATPRSTRPATRSCSGTPTTLTADSPTSARPAVNINIRKPPFGKRGAVFPFSRLFSLRISFWDGKCPGRASSPPGPLLAHRSSVCRMAPMTSLMALIRAYRLSTDSRICHGARSVLVLASISSTASS